MPRKYYKNKRTYWSPKKQAVQRSKYKYWQNQGMKAGSYAGAGYAKLASAYLGRYLGSTIDNWRYRRHIYNNKIRTYKVIGSRPRNMPRSGSRPQFITGSRPY